MRSYSGTCFCCHHWILKCYLLLNPKSFLYRIFEISLTWFLLLFVVKERCKHDLALSNQKICHGALLHYQLSQFASISMINNDYDFHLQNYCEITFIWIFCLSKIFFAHISSSWTMVEIPLYYLYIVYSMCHMLGSCLAIHMTILNFLVLSRRFLALLNYLSLLSLCS